MKIKYTKGGLAHANKKHNISKDRIEKALSSKIYSVVRDTVNNSIIIFTIDIAIVTDRQNRLKSAFPYSKRYMRNKTRNPENLLNIK